MDELCEKLVIGHILKGFGGVLMHKSGWLKSCIGNLPQLDGPFHVATFTIFLRSNAGGYFEPLVVLQDMNVGHSYRSSSIIPILELDSHLSF